MVQVKSRTSPRKAEKATPRYRAKRSPADEGQLLCEETAPSSVSCKCMVEFGKMTTKDTARSSLASH